MFVSDFLALKGLPRDLTKFNCVLLAGLQLLFDNFETASQKRVSSIGKENDDPTIYVGTGGIMYALSRAISALSGQGALSN